ncbi:MAG: deoxyribodipyrimidine photo-lyase [bacterium]|nr:deoxyribodipyrimidine photo-lyase [bacterium]
MDKKFKKVLFIFRRDLRIQDNTALFNATNLAESVLPVFIFDPRQTQTHDYFSETGFNFLLQALHDLDQELRDNKSELLFLKGFPHVVLEEVIKKEKIDAIFFNLDYTPFSRERDKQIELLCKKVGVELQVCHDLLLAAPSTVLKSDRTPYQIYTPFYRAASKLPVCKSNKIGNFEFDQYSSSFQSKVKLNHFLKFNPKEKSLRSEALRVFKNLTNFKDYAAQRDIPSLDSTTRLSVHNKFGTISVREFYHSVADSLGKEHVLIKELYWRDFFTHIGFHFPHVYTGAFHRKYDKIKWQNNRDHFSAWCLGQTGFPIVDAGMRELNQTGFMHNRVRMVVASFLTKDLHLDWHWGEKYFAQKLIDYDPAVNNGNWQWAASTGCDAQPYFRIFNPWMQQERFDPNSEYIKRWVPELKNLSPKEINILSKSQTLSLFGYPAPMVDHSVAKIDAEEMYRAVG